MSLSGFISLGEISDSIMGQAPPGEECNKDGVGIPFVKAGEFDVQKPVIREWTTKPQKFAKSTDVLLCVVGATCGKINLGIDCAIGRSVAAIRPDPKKLDQMFLYYFLLSWTERLRAMSQGAAQTVINKEMIANLQIPNLCLAEQKRIAAILDKADAIRRKRQQAIKLADDFLRSVFLEMFGDIPAKKSNYAFAGCRGYVSASSGKSSKDVISEKQTDIPIYGGNGINGYATKYLYSDPVVVIGRVGQQCAITNITSGPTWVTDNAIVVQVNDKSRYNAVYLAYAFMNSPIRDAVTKLDLPFINQSMILDTLIPLPPIDVQNQFEKIRTKVMTITEKLLESNNAFQNCFLALSQRAFQGNL